MSQDPGLDPNAEYWMKATITIGKVGKENDAFSEAQQYYKRLSAAEVPLIQKVVVDALCDVGLGQFENVPVVKKTREREAKKHQ